MNDHQDDIDRYLSGTMAEKDKPFFLLKLDEDPALRKEFAEQEKLAELIRLAALQEELESIHQAMETGTRSGGRSAAGENAAGGNAAGGSAAGSSAAGGNTAGASAAGSSAAGGSAAGGSASVKRISGKWWLAAAAAILLVVLGRHFLIEYSNPPEAKLFIAWYEPEPGLPTMMGAGQDDNGLMEAMVDYKTKDYPAAILKFNALLPYPRAQSPGQSHTDTVAFFYLASSYLAAGRTDSSFQLFAKLAGPQDRYSRLAQWYAALSCLRLGKREEAGSFLLRIASDPTHPYREKALKLSKELEGLPVKN